jgi:hypothetical protein
MLQAEIRGMDIFDPTTGEVRSSDGKNLMNDQGASPMMEQLALYRALLARIYPDRPVRAVLVWTEIPDPMELSAAMLDRALVRLTAA